jgi:SH3 domain-containing protein
MKRPKEQEKLKALARELERELSQENGQVKLLEETQERLRQAESICQELANENRGLRGEIAGWQERLAASEENQRQIGLLRQQLEALQAEHARVIGSHREMQEKIPFHSEEKISSRVENDTAEAMASHGEINEAAAIASDLAGSGQRNPDPTAVTEPTHEADMAKAARQVRMAWGWIIQNWHFGAIFAGVIIFIVAGTIAVNILRTEVPASRNTPSAPAATADEQDARPVSKSSTMAAPRVQGTFQTVRATQVFSEPSEDSALVAELEKGVKINVVGSRDGWFEIRSKHGRPPGFVRQEETIRIGRNP